MQDFDFDLFTIGGGSGGVRASRMAAGFGAKVAIAERRSWGGTCVNAGCIPKKLLAYAAHVPLEVEVAAAYGWTTDRLRFDWSTLLANKDAAIARLNKVYEDMLVQAGCTLFVGAARITGPHSVEVNGRTVTAKNILIATGGAPVVPEGPGAELVTTSDDAFHYPRLPEHILVIGGGYIACELAGIFAGLGSKTTLVHRGTMPLRGFDDEVRAHVLGELPQHGVNALMERTVEGVERDPAGRLRATLSDGAAIVADEVLCCIGRRPHTRNLGLEALGIVPDATGAIPVDASYRTRVPHIFAVGDVTNRVPLTPVALAEGMAVAYHLFGPKERPMRYENIPTAVFCAPPLAAVGLTEEQAIARGRPVDIYTTRFRSLKISLTRKQTRVLVKLVVDGDSQRVLGAHMVGDDAPEVIQGFAVALNCGATKDQLDMTLGIHPTVAEELVTLRTRTRRVDPSSAENQ